MKKMRKTVAFVMDTMIVGGVEKALIELLNHFDYDNFEVDLWIREDKFGIQDQVDKHVQIKSWPTYNTKDLLKAQLKKGQIFECVRSILYRIVVRCSKSWQVETLFATKLLPPIISEYNCVVAYQYGVPALVATANRINGQKRVLWVHGNYNMSNTLIRLMGKEYSEYNRIFCVSDATRLQFSQKWPNLTSKTQVFYNLIPASEILKKSKEQINVSLIHTSIVTVGRLSPEKGQQMIPQATRLLLDAGYDVFWYLVGDGDQRKTIEAEIQKYDVAEHVILLGTQMNPYPYIKNCDIYVQTSFSEGWCLTVQEARILQKPIVTTPLPVMHEQIISGENGLIAEAVTPEALFEGIRTLLDHPELQAKFVENLSHEVCDNSGELQKLYDFIES